MPYYGDFFSPIDRDLCPRVVAVRGLSRDSGCTSIAGNLAIELAKRSTRKVLLLDLSLWNTDLTKKGSLMPGLGIVEFGESLMLVPELKSEADIVINHLRSYHPSLAIDILPGTSDWLKHSVMRNDAAWKTIRELLYWAASKYEFVVADVGANVQALSTDSVPFIPSCIAHLAILHASSRSFDIFASAEEFCYWRYYQRYVGELYVDRIFIVNHTSRPGLFVMDPLLERVPRILSEDYFVDRTIFIPDVSSLIGAQSFSVVMDKITAGSRLSKKEKQFQEAIGKLAELCMTEPF